MKKQQEAQQKQKERHLKRKLKKERPLVNPDAGPDGLPANVLQNLVRAAQKHSVGNWQDFVKVIYLAMSPLRPRMAWLQPSAFPDATVLCTSTCRRLPLSGRRATLQHTLRRFAWD